MNAYSSKADSELIILLQEDDRRAFEEIYRRYAAPLFRFASDKVFERENVEEIVQETFVWLWSRRQKLYHVTELRPYLYGIVKHKVYNHIRHNVTKRQYAEYFQNYGSIIDNSNEELTNLADLLRILDHSISQLPERCQTAFKLSRVEHQPIPAIAQQMNISTRTVENYITQALKHLRDACAAFYGSRNDKKTEDE